MSTHNEPEATEPKPGDQPPRNPYVYYPSSDRVLVDGRDAYRSDLIDDDDHDNSDDDDDSESVDASEMRPRGPPKATVAGGKVNAVRR